MQKIILTLVLTQFLTSIISAQESESHPINSPPIPIEEISRFVNAYQLIRSRYVEEIKPQDLIDNAIKGMISELDPYSRYIPANDIDDFKNENNGSFVGIGITADISNKKLVITSVFKDSPAEKAGLESNDIIREIDGTPVTKQNVRSALDKLKGEAGSKVKLTIWREKKSSFEVSIKRSPIIIPSVAANLLNDVNLLHLKIYQFTHNTGEEARTAFNTHKNIKGVILDLRDNPGGTISSALEVADIFLEEGLIVSTKERDTGKLKKTHAKRQSNDISLPLIVMLNRNSASASELVAGALQDHKRALIVGQKSYGKGSVQTVFPTDNNGAIKLTISRYYTPKGRAIQALGIVPDISLTPLTVKPTLESPDSYYEADLSNHISGEEPSDSEEESNSNGKDSKKSSNELTSKKQANILARKDLELYEAINIMKALQFSNHPE